MRRAASARLPTRHARVRALHWLLSGFAGHVCGVFFVFGADVLQHVRVREEALRRT